MAMIYGAEVNTVLYTERRYGALNGQTLNKKPRLSASQDGVEVAWEGVEPSTSGL